LPTTKIPTPGTQNFFRLGGFPVRGGGVCFSALRFSPGTPAPPPRRGAPWGPGEKNKTTKKKTSLGGAPGGAGVQNVVDFSGARPKNQGWGGRGRGRFFPRGGRLGGKKRAVGAGRQTKAGWPTFEKGGGEKKKKPIWVWGASGQTEGGSIGVSRGGGFSSAPIFQGGVPGKKKKGPGLGARGEGVRPPKGGGGETIGRQGSNNCSWGGGQPGRKGKSPLPGGAGGVKGNPGGWYPPGGACIRRGGKKHPGGARPFPSAKPARLAWGKQQKHGGRGGGGGGGGGGRLISDRRGEPGAGGGGGRF